jgi:ribosomal-protein-alanine N-acetyltransferase
MNLKIDAHLSLGYFLPEDVVPMSDYMNDIEIYNNTLRVPHPYTLQHAKDWVAENIDRQQQNEPIENYTIRYDGHIIGGIGYMPCHGFMAHTAEIGYWMAKPYRNKGLMTKVVGFFCDLIFENQSFTKLTAHTYISNAASSVVLEKNGFKQEGTLLKHYLKGENYIDCKLYALLKTGL